MSLLEAARREELREELLRELPGKKVVEEGKQGVRQEELREERHGQLGQVVQLESVARRRQGSQQVLAFGESVFEGGEEVTRRGGHELHRMVTSY